MFTRNFYPTSRSTYDLMCINPHGKTVLEPSAGKGDLVEYMYADGAKEVLSCEKNSDLAQIVKRKSNWLKPDFFDVVSNEISHIDMIVMNPPFEDAEKHILHAYEIAPNGCVIYSLCNTSTLNVLHTEKRKQLSILIKDFGEFQDLGNVFSESERKTNVGVSCIIIRKPSVFNEFGDFFTDDPDDEFGNETGGLISYNEIRSIVQSYIDTIKTYREFSLLASKLKKSTSRLGVDLPIKVEIEYNKSITDEKSFNAAMQKKGWSYVFNKVGADKYLTKGVKADLNRFIEQQEKITFTMKNIHLMLDVLIGTRSQTLDRALVESVDHYTRYTHDNRFSIEGWKTNSGHMLNEKFIIERMATPKFSGGLEVCYYGDCHERLEDLVKVLCFVTGKDYNKIKTINQAPCEFPFQYEEGREVDRYSRPINYNKFIANTWYESEFFDVKVFKKGTMHLKFRDRKVWEKLNREYARVKGQVLPENI